MKAIRLKTADLTDAFGIDILKPRLSWNCSGGKVQTAFRVVARNEKKETVFDTGKRASHKMYCDYEGNELASRSKISWQVCLWDETNIPEWSAEAYFEMGLIDRTDWCAKWICGVDTNKEERLPADYYLREFSICEPVASARLYITALGVYSVRINDISIGNILAPGSTAYDKRVYYQTYDLTQYLTQENSLEICVADGWYKGKLGADQQEYVFGHQTKLLAQLEIRFKSGKKEIIGTDHSFRWCNNGPIRFTDLKDGEVYDARMRPRYVDYAIVDINEGRIPTASNSPAIAEQEVFSPVLEISPNGKNILNFGQNIAGYIRFRVKEAAGTELTISMFEAKDHGEYSDASLSFPQGNVNFVKQKITFIASGKPEMFQPEFFYSGFQYALVEGLTKINPSDFEAVAVYSDIEYGGHFSCSNEKLNKFFNNTVWSMKSNFIDVPTDCPQREKSGWTGDAQVFCNTATYIADTKAFFRKWLRDVADGQEGNGRVANVNPRCGQPGSRTDMLNGSCGWADAAIIIPYTLWKNTGDDSFIIDNYELMRNWKNYIINLCEDKTMFTLSDGHPLESLRPIYEKYKLKDSKWNKYIPEAGFHWGEWCVPESQEPVASDPITELIKPKQELTCAYTYYSMTLLEQMMRHVGKNDEADICREYAYGSKEAYHFHWVKDDKIDTKHMAELVRPIALGLLNDQEKKNVAEELALMVTHRNFKVGTGFLSTPFLLQTLAENGYLRTAY
jgi:alpha-L-rhamnosidase